MTKTTMAEFLRRGFEAQTAVDRVLDAVGTTGGKATTETLRPRRDSFDKIRQKSYLTPKQYKTGKPGLVGRARLEARIRALAVEAERFAKRAGQEDNAPSADWGIHLARTLRAFL